MNSKNIDNKMKLLAGKEIYANDIPIKPLTLGEVAEIGYSNLQQSLQVISLGLNDMIESIDDFELQALLLSEKHNLTAFDMYMMSDGMKNLLIDGLKLFFRTDFIEAVEVDDNDFSIMIDDKYKINRDNFNIVVEIIEMQNNPSVSKSSEDEDYNPANDLAKGIADKLKKGKEIAKQSKSVDSEKSGIAIDDVISAVTGMSNSVNKVNVWDYTIYQLYDEFARLVKIDNYNLQIQASMWSSDVETEHWSEPL